MRQQSESRGVAARTLRRAAFWLVLLAAGGFMALDRAAGFDTLMDGLMLLAVYAFFVAVPIQILFRDVRLGPGGVAVFAGAVLAIVGMFWALPIQRAYVYDGSEGLVALHRLTGGGDLDSVASRPWNTAVVVCGLLAAVGVLVLDVMVWRLQRSSRGHAVNPAAVGSVTATFATLAEPQGGTSVTRPAVAPRLAREGPEDELRPG